MKQWIALTLVGALAVLAAGWFLLVSPKRSDAASVRALVQTQNSTNVGLQAQLETLKAQAKNLPMEQARLAQVAAKIPDNPALPSLIRALSKAADDSGVELVSLAPGQPSPVTAAPGAAGRPVAPTTGSTGSPAGAASAGAGTLESIGLSLNVAGRYFQIEQFFDQVEHLSRAMKVLGFTLAPGANPMKAQSGSSTSGAAVSGYGGTLTTSITANVYMAAGRISAAPAALAGK